MSNRSDRASLRGKCYHLDEEIHGWLAELAATYGSVDRGLAILRASVPFGEECVKTGSLNTSTWDANNGIELRDVIPGEYNFPKRQKETKLRIATQVGKGSDTSDFAAHIREKFGDDDSMGICATCREYDDVAICPRCTKKICNGVLCQTIHEHLG